MSAVQARKEAAAARGAAASLDIDLEGGKTVTCDFTKEGSLGIVFEGVNLMLLAQGLDSA